jgi:putative peptidoglycan lipid II flippase
MAAHCSDRLRTVARLTGMHISMRRDTINVVLCGLLAQATGFVKLLLVARHFGVGADLDGYYLALTLPTLLQGFLSGVLQASFVPVYMALRHRSDTDGAAALASAVGWRLLALLVGCSVLLSAASGPLMTGVAGGAGPAVIVAASAAFSVLAYATLANGLIDYGSLLLNAHGRYVAAALGPVVNALLSTAILVLWPQWGLDNLVWGLMAGLIAQLAMTLVACHAERIEMFARSRSTAEQLRRVYRLTVPILLGVFIANANTAIVQLMSAHAGEGAVSTIGYATRLHGVLVQVFAIGASAVLLPTFSTSIASSDISRVVHILRTTFRVSLLIGATPALFVGTIGGDVVSLLLQRGEFDAGARQAVSRTWMVYTLALLPTCWGVFVAKYFQAAQKPWVITRLALLSFATTAIVGAALLAPVGLLALPIASGLAYTAVAVGFQKALVADLGLPVLKGETVRTAGVLAVLALAWAAVSATVHALAEASPLLRIVVVIPMAALAAAIMARLLLLIERPRLLLKNTT